MVAYSHLRYKCNSGYHVVGDEFRTCYPSGEWTGTTPFCARGKLHPENENAIESDISNSNVKAADTE